jgi:hypothetical protein
MIIDTDTMTTAELEAKLQEILASAKIKNKQKASEDIARLKEEAMDKIREAQTIADENGVSFTFSVDYGICGTYYPARDAENNDDWYSSDEGWPTFVNEGWVSSSYNC